MLIKLRDHIITPVFVERVSASKGKMELVAYHTSVALQGQGIGRHLEIMDLSYVVITDEELEELLDGVSGETVVLMAHGNDGLISSVFFGLDAHTRSMAQSVGLVVDELIKERSE